MSHPYLIRFQKWGGFPSYFWAAAFVLVAGVMLPTTTFLRFQSLANTFGDPHIWRQSQTAITISYFLSHGINLFDYRSPYGGELWNWIYEFPLYQAVVAFVVKQTALSIETVSRLVTLFFFFGSAAALFRLSTLLFGRQVAFWALLMYLISPFHLLFSRACLVGMTVEFFVLAGLWLYAEGFYSKKGGAWLLLLGTLMGAIGAAVKVQNWYLPTTVFFLFFAWHAWFQKNKKAWSILGLYMVQLGVAVSWVFWANHVRGESGEFVIHHGWFFGQLADRLQWVRWEPMIRSITRDILHDWMILPAVLSLFLAHRFRLWAWAFLAVTFVPILVMFNVYQLHDYYLMAQSPFLILMAALGLVALLESRSPLRNYALILFVTVFSYRMVKFQYVTGPLFKDYHETRVAGERLKTLSHVDDVIFQPGTEGRLENIFYSQRLLGTWNDTDLKKVQPSLIQYHNPGDVDLEFLATQSRMWIEGGPSYFAYRFREAGDRVLDVKKHIAVLDKVEGKTTSFVSEAVSTCGQAQSTVINLPNQKGLVAVKSEAANDWLVFPARNYLNLPIRSPWGCRYQVKFLPDTRSKGNQELG